MTVFGGMDAMLLFRMKLAIARAKWAQEEVDNMLSPVQCKMARAALGLGVRELAKAADVSVNTVTRLERGEKLLPRTMAAVLVALEAGGVQFINTTARGSA